MNAFHQASQVEAAGVPEIVEWLLDNEFQVTLFSGDHPSIKALQKVGDAVVSRKGEQFVVDFKVEKKTTGNLFIEWWSNRNPLMPTPGWGAKSKSRYVLYYFTDTKMLYFLDTEKLSKFLTKDNCWKKYCEIEQQEYNQPNITTGLIVPIEDLNNAGVFPSAPRNLSRGVA